MVLRSNPPLEEEVIVGEADKFDICGSILNKFGVKGPTKPERDVALLVQCNYFV